MLCPICMAAELLWWQPLHKCSLVITSALTMLSHMRRFTRRKERLLRHQLLQRRPPEGRPSGALQDAALRRL